MTIREWIKRREIGGTSHFSVEELQSAFPQMSDRTLKNELYRLSSQKIIISVYKGFYVIIPVQYASTGVVPAVYYIDQLMAYIGKHYYISLLSAAEMLGAAHQRPQNFYVTTLRPSASVSSDKNPILKWLFITDIPEEFLLQRNSQTGVVKYSNAELTSIDIIQYSHYIGGITRASTLLAELTESTDFNGKIDKLIQISSLSTIQRLGYIIEEIIGDTEQADTIYEQLKATKKRLNYILLNTHSTKKAFDTNKKWRVNINTEIEIDEL